MHGHGTLITRPRLYDVVTRVAFAGRERAVRRRIAALAEVRSGERCLDVAAGTGSLTRALVQAGGDAVALDAAGEMVNVAAHSVPAVVAIAQQLPFRDASYDVV